MGDTKELLFIGDSLIEFFNWQERFDEHRVINLGRSGETVQELAARSKMVVDADYSPDFIFVMIGTNNVAMDDFSYWAAYQEIVDNLQQICPADKIVLTGLFPMRLPWLSEDIIERLNDLLKNLAKDSGCVYLEGWSEQSADQCYRGFSEDGVHLSSYGYEAWSATVEKFLRTY